MDINEVMVFLLDAINRIDDNFEDGSTEDRYHYALGAIDLAKVAGLISENLAGVLECMAIERKRK